MFKLRLIKTMVLGVCLTLASSGAVYANEDKAGEFHGRLPATASTMIAPDTPVASPANPGQGIDAELLELQRKIEYFVFEQHRGEFADKGFSVTHTGPMGDYVEIGIQPYSEASAEYLYSKFGKERVKVVEGQFASTLAAASGSAEPALDTPLMTDIATSVDEDALEIQANVVSDNVEGTGEVSITSAEGQENAEESSNALLYGLGAVVVLGAGAFGIKRILPPAKSK